MATAEQVLAFLTLVFLVGAIGGVLFFVVALERMGADERRFVQRRVLISVLLAALCLALPLPLAVVGEGGARALVRVPSYVEALRRLTFDALPLQALGLALCLLVYRRTLPAYGLAMTGALLLATTFAQWDRVRDITRPDTYAALVLHVATAAFWFGSYGPLIFIARRADTRAAADFIRFWISIAQRLIAVVVLAGFWLLWRMDGGLAAYKTHHGALTLTKTGLVLIMLSLALVNRRRHLPRMEAGDVVAATQLVRQIRRERLIAYAVLALTLALLSAG